MHSKTTYDKIKSMINCYWHMAARFSKIVTIHNNCPQNLDEQASHYCIKKLVALAGQYGGLPAVFIWRSILVSAMYAVSQWGPSQNCYLFDKHVSTVLSTRNDSLYALGGLGPAKCDKAKLRSQTFSLSSLQFVSLMWMFGFRVIM